MYAQFGIPPPDPSPDELRQMRSVHIRLATLAAVCTPIACLCSFFVVMPLPFLVMPVLMGMAYCLPLPLLALGGITWLIAWNGLNNPAKYHGTKSGIAALVKLTVLALGFGGLLYFSLNSPR